MMNNLKTVALLGGLAGVLIAIGGMIGGRGGAVFGLILALAVNMGAYWFSDRIALKASRAKPVSRAEAPELYTMVESLAGRANLPMPKLYVTPSEQPNAFATGRNPEHAAVAVTQGIMRMLSPHELQGVIAHEFAHVKNRDILITSVAATIAGAISFIAQMAQWGAIFGGFGRDDDEGPGMIGLLVGIFIAPIAAMILQLAISRSREYHADAIGAQIAGQPMGLASALRKLERGAEQTPMRVNPSVAPLFIVNPLRGRFATGAARLFSTHPPTAERVRRLQLMESTIHPTY